MGDQEYAPDSEVFASEEEEAMQGQEPQPEEMTEEDAQISEAAQRNLAELQQKQQALQQMQMQLRIIEEEETEFWKIFDEHRQGSYYDLTVDEIQATPTYRLSTLGAITELMHQGIQIPQEILIRYLDIEESVKDEWMGMLGQQQQQAAQMQQAQQQFLAQIEQLKGEMALMKQAMANKGIIAVAQIKAGAQAGAQAGV